MTRQLLLVDHQPFDYQYLKYLLKDYRYPRNKIGKLLRNGEIVAIKSGLYVLSGIFGKKPLPEQVANLLYGPSYVSLDYALSRYGLIPERVFSITSVCIGRRKAFDTAVGYFSYLQMKPEYYSLAYVRHVTTEGSYLIATPEKALCDRLYYGPAFSDITALKQYLFYDMRVDEMIFSRLDAALISRLAEASGKRSIRLLAELLK